MNRLSGKQHFIGKFILENVPRLFDQQHLVQKHVAFHIQSANSSSNLSF